jgi:hypothetical protein
LNTSSSAGTPWHITVIYILGWEALLRNKRAVARQKDLADVEKLLAIAKRKNAG